MYDEVFQIVPENKVRSLMVSTIDINIKDFAMGSIGIGSYAAKLKVWRRNSIDEVINIQIGNFVSIAADVNFVVNLNHDYKNITTSPVGIFAFIERENYTKNQRGSIIVGNDVWIGNGVTVLPDVKIGDGAVIGNGAVIAKDVPPYAIVVGNPARVIKYRFEKEQIKKLRELKWWYWDLKHIEACKREFIGSVNNFISKFYKVENEQLEKVELNKKSKGILFIPDFEEKQYPVWKKVLKQYVNNFKAEDDVTLIIRIKNNDKFKENVSSISNFIYDDPGNPDILILNDNVKNIKSIFKDMEYFITTRAINTIRYIDYCEDLNVKVIPGINVDIFKNVL